MKHPAQASEAKARDWRTFKIGDKVLVTFAEQPNRAKLHRAFHWPKSVVGVVHGYRVTGLDLNHPDAPDARYGFTGFTWGRVFYDTYRRQIMSVAGAPPYQARVASIELVTEVAYEDYECPSCGSQVRLKLESFLGPDCTACTGDPLGPHPVERTGPPQGMEAG